MGDKLKEKNRINKQVSNCLVQKDVNPVHFYMRSNQNRKRW